MTTPSLHRVGRHRWRYAGIHVGPYYLYKCRLKGCGDRQWATFKKRDGLWRLDCKATRKSDGRTR